MVVGVGLVIHFGYRDMSCYWQDHLLARFRSLESILLMLAVCGLLLVCWLVTRAAESVLTKAVRVGTVATRPALMAKAAEAIQFHTRGISPPHPATAPSGDTAHQPSSSSVGSPTGWTLPPEQVQHPGQLASERTPPSPRPPSKWTKCARRAARNVSGPWFFSMLPFARPITFTSHGMQDPWEATALQVQLSMLPSPSFIAQELSRADESRVAEVRAATHALRVHAHAHARRGSTGTDAVHRRVRKLSTAVNLPDLSAGRQVDSHYGATRRSRATTTGDIRIFIGSGMRAQENNGAAGVGLSAVGGGSLGRSHTGDSSNGESKRTHDDHDTSGGEQSFRDPAERIHRRRSSGDALATNVWRMARLLQRTAEERAMVHAALDTPPPAYSWYKGMHPTAYATCLAAASTLVLWFAKCVAELAKAQYYLPKGFVGSTLIGFPFAVIIALTFQHYVAASAFVLFDSAYVLPMYQTWYMSFSIAVGAVFFQEFALLSTTYTALVAVGCAFCVIGSSVLADQTWVSNTAGTTTAAICDNNKRVAASQRQPASTRASASGVDVTALAKAMGLSVPAYRVLDRPSAVPRVSRIRRWNSEPIATISDLAASAGRPVPPSFIPTASHSLAASAVERLPSQNTTSSTNATGSVGSASNGIHGRNAAAAGAGMNAGSRTAGFSSPLPEFVRLFRPKETVLRQGWRSHFVSSSDDNV